MPLSRRATDVAAPQKTRAAEAALMPWIEFGPENVLEGEMQGKLNQARTAERTLHKSCPELHLPV
jgi:hypothetical protein